MSSRSFVRDRCLKAAHTFFLSLRFSDCDEGPSRQNLGYNLCQASFKDSQTLSLDLANENAIILLWHLQLMYASLTMSMSFLCLPPEIRLAVYDHLFSEESRIPIGYRDFEVPLKKKPGNKKSTGVGAAPAPRLVSYSPPGWRTQCHSAILRTCSQVYQETLPFLYTTHSFVYMIQGVDNSLLRGTKTSPISQQQLESIQHLEFTINPRTNQLAKNIAGAMVGLIKEASASKTITLHSQLVWGQRDDEKCHDWAFHLLHRSEFLECLTTSSNLRDVWIKAGDDHGRGRSQRSQFAALTNAILARKGWVCEEDKRPPEPEDIAIVRDGEIIAWKQRPGAKPVGEKERAATNEWLWHLRPHTISQYPR